MNQDNTNLGTLKISKLFRIYFFPTLFGMLALCAVTATDGIFVGRGVGDEGLAAVNICIPPTMIIVGIGLMLGIGASVTASIYYAKRKFEMSLLNISQALFSGTAVSIIFLAITLSMPCATSKLLGSSNTLMPLVLDYLPWIFICCLFQVWCVIGLFVIRLDGSPKYAMWCNIIPGVMNVILDYILIFPLDMGIKGAGIATCISCMAGGIMVLTYLFILANDLRLTKIFNIKLSLRSLHFALRNIVLQCKIGISALLGESTMGILMFVGNWEFMKYLGDTGVGAFSIACYYCPFAFMIGNAIAQSAQPIISYNYGINQSGRVRETERNAIITSGICGAVVTLIFIFLPGFLVSLFTNGDSESAVIAEDGFPLFSMAFIFFIFNLTAIGYYQSVEKVIPSIIFALLRGAVFLIPYFILSPIFLGIKGLWLALAFSEASTTVCICMYYAINKAACAHNNKKSE